MARSDGIRATLGHSGSSRGRAQSTYLPGAPAPDPQCRNALVGRCCIHGACATLATHTPTATAAISLFLHEKFRVFKNANVLGLRPCHELAANMGHSLWYQADSVSLIPQTTHQHIWTMHPAPLHFRGLWHRPDPPAASIPAPQADHPISRHTHGFACPRWACFP